MARVREQRKPARRIPSTLEQVDELHRCCAQAIAIAGLLMEADVDPEIQDSAWAIQSLVEQIRVIGGSLVR